MLMPEVSSVRGVVVDRLEEKESTYTPAAQDLVAVGAAISFICNQQRYKNTSEIIDQRVHPRSTISWAEIGEGLGFTVGK